MNTKIYGIYAVSLCTTYFLHNGYQVLLPFGDAGRYDLVVEKDGVFQRVQCKRARVTKQGYPCVSLRVSGSVKKGDNGISRRPCYRYTKGDFDLLWIATPYTCYLIPLSDVLLNKDSKADLQLFPKWDKYRIVVPMPHPSGDEGVIRRASPRLTEDDKSTIKQLRKAGKTEQEIADILSVTRSCISQFLSRSQKS